MEGKTSIFAQDTQPRSLYQTSHKAKSFLTLEMK